MVLPTVVIPATNAQEPIKAATFAYINAIPNLVGVGEYTLIHYGVTIPTAWPQTGWTGITVEIVGPDNQTQTLGPLTTDLTGGGGVTFAPSMVGTYLIRTHFPEQVATQDTAGFPNGTIIGAAVSSWFELTVQQEPRQNYPGTPLPEEYWSRPIDGQFREWSVLAGSTVWYNRGTEITEPSMIQDFNDDAPEAGHILWAKALFGGAFSPLGGGLAGGATGDHAFETGDAYEGLFTPPIVMSGVIYYNRYKNDGGTRVEQEVVAADLRTGEELWTRNWDNRRLDFGQSFFYTGFNYHAVFQYLWETTGSTWAAYEASSGRWAYSMTNVPSGYMTYGPNGEIIIYTIDLAHNWMTKWNSRWVIDAQRWVDQEDPNSRFGSWLREYQGRTLDGRLGIEWNTTIPDLPGEVQKIRDGVVLGTNFEKRAPAPDTPMMWAFTFDPGHTPIWDDIHFENVSYGRVPRINHDPKVTLSFNTTWPDPAPFAILNVEDASIADDLFTVVRTDQPTAWGFSLSTGHQIWGPFGPMHYQTHWSYESGNSWDLIHNGRYFAGGHGGTLYALDAKTGESLWNYTMSDPYAEYKFNNDWRYRIAIITDGKIYIEHTEHSPYDPKPRGAPFVCLNETTGEEIWRLNLRGTEWGGTAVIGDSIIVRDNTYDQRVYAIGKGPSETSVTIQNNVVTFGNPVLIQGTVNDISAGTKDEAITARFPNGVPAVSDESMTQFMEYVYLQKARPTNTTGVSVTLSVLDPNNNTYEIGTATADATGAYSLLWDPLVPGKHTVISSFEGSESYWPSQTETVVAITDAPLPSGAPQVAPDMTGTYVMYAAIAIIAAIIVVGAVIVILLRKKP
jgi:outer membrane protein assembly factor BamB